MSPTTFNLNTGATIPVVGFGTWQSKPNVVKDAVLAALKAGYRHIDTAFVYGNEKEIGEAIKESGVPRSELFITTKLWNNKHEPEDVAGALEISLNNLGLEYIDLYLMHWPVAFQSGGEKVPKDKDGNVLLSKTKFTETYAAMEKLDTNKTRAIGVSNFNVEKLEELRKTQTKAPAVNQVEMHPLLAQEDLVKYCKDQGIIVTAYSPLGSTNSPFLASDTIAKIAKKYDATPAQILISWSVKRNVVVIPKSVTPSRIVENFKVVDLKDADFEKINELRSEYGHTRLIDPKDLWGTDAFASL